MPTLSGLACATESQKASSVCALSVRPESKMVTGNLDGQAAANLVEGLLDGEERGLGVERVEDGLDEQRIDAALDQAERLLA